MKNEFLFSVIMPIYNTGEFLDEAIESIINQTIGFEESIQLILINDGSTDDSEEICKKYQERYKDNIVYKYKENGGVSSARNEGRKYVKGKYFNFLDSDDKWDKNAFEKVYDFFERNYDDIDIVNTRLEIFGGNNYTHPLDYKFDKGNRIVDLDNDFDCIQLGNASCFFKTEAFNDLYHNTKLVVAEDMFFIGQACLKNKKYGLLKDAVYYYRRLNNSNSISSNCKKKKTWYTDVIRECHKSLIKMSLDKYKEVPKFIQYMMLYEIQWRIYKNNFMDEVLTEEELDMYKNLVLEVLKYIDDDVIGSFKNKDKLLKIYLLKLKYQKNSSKDYVIKDGRYVYYRNALITDLKSRSNCTLTIINTKNGKLKLEGMCNPLIDMIYESKKYKLIVKDDTGRIHTCKLIRLEYLDRLSFANEKIARGLSFEFEIPISKINHLEFFITDSKNEYPIRVWLGQYSRLTNQMKKTYCAIGKCYILKFFRDKLRVYKYTKKMHIISELRYIKELLSKKEYKVVIDRINYYINKLFYKKPIWIVRDRYEKAGDNGEAVFKYLSTWENKDKYNIYFLLNKDSKDYDRLKQYGKIIDPRSKKYKKLFLLSSKIIDSIITPESINLYKKKGMYYRNLYNFDYIALFHGIGQRDMSVWTNKFNYNIKIYVSGAKKEYEAMLKENNGYDKDVLKLTGLPRFDELRKEDKKIVVFMPTWRADIAAPLIKGTNQRGRVDNFKETSYYEFYNSLINNKKLISVMKKYGYAGVFYNHPNFNKQAVDFEENDTITVSKANANANDVISECSMLVTDYSSAFFECAYLKKPVVYTQFDHDDFVKRHIGTDGYYNYNTDSFGPICYDLDTSVDAIIKYLKNNCKIEEKYKKRIDKFFIYNDKNNCKRLINEVLKYDKEKQKDLKKMEENR